MSNEKIIRGCCTDFVCRFCRTKAGWAHQIWCENPLTEPGCRDCQYHGVRCKHPAHRMKKKERREMQDEKAEHSL